MSSASGHYRLDSPAAEFFGSTVLHLLAREGKVLGRFGRLGFLRGQLEGNTLQARWTASQAYGWLTLHFDRDFKEADCRYGVDDQDATGSAHLSKITRRSKRRAS